MGWGYIYFSPKGEYNFVGLKGAKNTLSEYDPLYRYMQVEGYSLRQTGHDTRRITVLDSD